MIGREVIANVRDNQGDKYKEDFLSVLWMNASEAKIKMRSFYC